MIKIKSVSEIFKEMDKGMLIYSGIMIGTVLIFLIVVALLT